MSRTQFFVSGGHRGSAITLALALAIAGGIVSGACASGGAAAPSPATTSAAVSSGASTASPAATHGAPTQGNESARAVVIDTDMAPDDWLAIIYLLRRPEVTVQAITVSGTGEAHCEPGVRHALELVALAGQPDIPVACGRETPLSGAHAFPDEWRTAVDPLLGLNLPENPTEPYPGGAVELLGTTLGSTPNSVTLLALVFGAHAFVWGTTSTVVRQRAVPDEFLGRVTGVYRVASVGGLVAGTPLGGVLAGAFGITAPFWFGFLGSAALVVILWRQFDRIAHASAVDSRPINSSA